MRFVAVDNRLLWDQGQKLQGRGAYLHPSPACCSRFCGAARWEQALRPVLQQEPGNPYYRWLAGTQQ